MSTELVVSVTREDRFWVATVAGVRGGATETRRLAALDVEVRDLLSGLLDVPENSLRLVWHWEPALGVGAVKRLHEYRDARAGLEQAQARYERAQHEAVHDLRDAGVSLRDVAALLELSFQRVQQLTGI